VLYRESDIGQRKRKSAGETLVNVNPDVNIETIDARITDANINEIMEGIDVIPYGIDN